MMYLSCDIPDYTSLKDFLEDLSCGGRIPSTVIKTLLNESLSTLYYVIRIAGPKDVSLRNLRPENIDQILSGYKESCLENGLIFTPEDVILKDPILG